MRSRDLPYIAWRNGRPRFAPGPRERALGFTARDLRHDDRRWYTRDEAHAFAFARKAEIAQAREGKLIIAPRGRAPKIEGWVYFLRSEERIKIGFSRNPFTRKAGLATGMAGRIAMLAAVPGNTLDERKLHAALAKYQLHGEWFSYDVEVARAIIRCITFGRVVTDEAKGRTKVARL